MLQEIPLRDEERAAVEDGVKEMAKLTSGLRYAAAPEGHTLRRSPRSQGQPVRLSEIDCDANSAAAGGQSPLSDAWKTKREKY